MSFKWVLLNEFFVNIRSSTMNKYLSPRNVAESFDNEAQEDSKEKKKKDKKEKKEKKEKKDKDKKKDKKPTKPVIKKEIDDDDL